MARLLRGSRFGSGRCSRPGPLQRGSFEGAFVLPGQNVTPRLPCRRRSAGWGAGDRFGRAPEHVCLRGETFAPGRVTMRRRPPNGFPQRPMSGRSSVACGPNRCARSTRTEPPSCAK
jgi:hypothetical protein